MSCISVLRKNGFKLTPQRRLILECIHDSASHLTAEDILRFVDARAPGVDKSTVYRTLDLLEGSGCVLRSEVNGRFAYHHAEDGHHHHLVCSKCGKTIDCDENLFASVEKSLREKHGFQVDFKHAVISGFCKECRDSRN